MNIRMTVWTWACVLPVLLFTNSSCNTPKQIQTAPASTNASKVTEQPSEVLTVILKAYRDHKGAISFGINNIVRKEGYFKNMNKRRQKDYFKAIVADKHGKAIDSSFFENPLKQRLEYSEDDGSVAAKNVEKEQGYCSIRINYSQSVSTLNIFDSNNEKLATLDITQIK